MGRAHPVNIHPGHDTHRHPLPQATILLRTFCRTDMFSSIASVGGLVRVLRWTACVACTTEQTLADPHRSGSYGK